MFAASNPLNAIMHERREIERRLCKFEMEASGKPEDRLNYEVRYQRNNITVDNASIVREQQQDETNRKRLEAFRAKWNLIN